MSTVLFIDDGRDLVVTHTGRSLRLRVRERLRLRSVGDKTPGFRVRFLFPGRYAVDRRGETLYLSLGRAAEGGPWVLASGPGSFLMDLSPMRKESA